MPNQILTIARNTFVESVRQPIYFILIAIAGLAQLFTTWSAGFSMGMTEAAEVSGDNKLLFDVGMATVFVCGMLLSAFLATAVISKEIENKTVLTVVSKPVSRPAVVLGKYLGVSGAIVIAVITMLLFLQMAIRHQVLSTTADELDGPVILFTGLAVVVSLAVAIWCNYFYGWVFTQTATMLMFPLMIAAWAVVMLVSKKWVIQPIATDWKPQIAMVSVGIVFAQLVLTAIATAASARLGQVMTLVVCCGVFGLGLVSSHFLGNRAVDNTFVARIKGAQPELIGQASLESNGDTYNVTMEFEPRIRIKPGVLFYYGPNPSGLGLCTPVFEPFKGDLNDMAAMSDRNRPGALVVTNVVGKAVTVKHVGADGRVASRPPGAEDLVFLQPTRYNPAVLAIWGMITNVQYFWLVDAVTQNQPIPLAHMGLVAMYALAQIGVYLSLAVVLFQKREVG